eukprot:GHVN01048612.1.p1 GENE.GHVN01048612.1~~GHVN01048612.1.p1  ORF type:complete len:363 (+),score=24.42 GHVN01048612.1:43-1131(+)
MLLEKTKIGKISFKNHQIPCLQAFLCHPSMSAFAIPPAQDPARLLGKGPYQPGEKFRAFDTRVARFAKLCENTPYAGCLTEELSLGDIRARIEANLTRTYNPPRTNFTNNSLGSLSSPRPVRHARANVVPERFSSKGLREALYHTTHSSDLSTSCDPLRRTARQNQSDQMTILCQSQYPSQAAYAHRGGDDYGLAVLKNKERGRDTLFCEGGNSARRGSLARSLIDPPDYVTQEQKKMFPEKRYDTSVVLSDTASHKLTTRADRHAVIRCSSVRGNYGKDGPSTNVFNYDLPTRRDPNCFNIPIKAGRWNPDVLKCNITVSGSTHSLQTAYRKRQHTLTSNCLPPSNCPAVALVPPPKNVKD